MRRTCRSEGRPPSSTPDWAGASRASAHPVKPRPAGPARSTKRTVCPIAHDKLDRIRYTTCGRRRAGTAITPCTSTHSLKHYAVQGPLTVLISPPAASGSRRRPASAPLSFCSRLRVHPRPGLAPALCAGRITLRRRPQAGAGRYRGVAFPTRGVSHAEPSQSRRSRAVNAAAVAAELGARAEAVCRHYLPHGRRQGRYWVAGDLDGARGRSLYVRLGPPGTPGKSPTRRQANMATCSISSAVARARRRCARRSTRPAPSSPCRLRRLRARAASATRRKRRGACGGVAAPSTAPMRNATSRRGVSRAAASRRCASTPSFAIAKARRCAASRRWSPP